LPNSVSESRNRPQRSERPFLLCYVPFRGHCFCHSSSTSVPTNGSSRSVGVCVFLHMWFTETSASESALCTFEAETTEICLVPWTTTPWTLPLNRALALNPSADYAVVEVCSVSVCLCVSVCAPLSFTHNHTHTQHNTTQHNTTQHTHTCSGGTRGQIRRGRAVTGKPFLIIVGSTVVTALMKHISRSCKYRSTLGTVPAQFFVEHKMRARNPVVPHITVASEGHTHRERERQTDRQRTYTHTRRERQGGTDAAKVPILVDNMVALREKTEKQAQTEQEQKTTKKKKKKKRKNKGQQALPVPVLTSVLHSAPGCGPEDYDMVLSLSLSVCVCGCVHVCVCVCGCVFVFVISRYAIII